MLWDLQSNLMCLMANLNIPKGKKKTTPAEFNPYAKRNSKPKKPKNVLREMAATIGLSPMEQAKLERLLADKERRLKNVRTQHQDR